MIWYLFVLLGLKATPASAAGTGSGCQIDTLGIHTNERLNGMIGLMKAEKFTTYNSRNAIPAQVKKQLDCLSGAFEIADPDQEYACCCTSPRSLPRRQLLYLGKSKHMLVMSYIVGGIAIEPHILLIRFNSTGIVDLWNATSWAYVKSNKEIVQYIQRHRGKKSDLHINFGI